ncbi:MAG TPA: DUF1622 domain-containing protein [Croceibacterium sp.]
MVWLDQIAELLASGIELVMLAILTIGTLRAVRAVAGHVVRSEALAGKVREIWLHYAGWIVLGLDLALAADLIRTVIEPGWEDIGQLAAIGAIRTALAWFLAKDIAEWRDAPVAKAGQ